MVASHRFEVDSRYTNPLFIGCGAYGCVCVAEDKKAGGTVAIKKIFNIQGMDATDATRTLREIKVLRHVYGHQNIISLSSVGAPYNVENLNELYLFIRSFDDESSAMDLSKYIFLHLNQGVYLGILANIYHLFLLVLGTSGHWLLPYMDV